MLKLIGNFIKILSAKTQIITILVLSVLGITVFAAFAYLSNMQPKQSTALAKIQQDLNQLDESHMSMRHHETENYGAPSPKNITEFHEKAKQSVYFIDQILPLVSEDAVADLNFIKQRLLTYENLFESSVKAQNQLGFSANNGLQGEIANAVNSIQRELYNLQTAGTSLNQINKIRVELLILRHHEKDFMLYLEDKYLIQFDTQLSKLYSALTASSLPTASLLQIRQDLGNYSQKFQQWNDTSFTIDEGLFNLDEIFDSFSPVIKDLVVRYQIFGDQYNQQMMSNQKLSKTYLIVSIIIIAVLLLAIAIMLLLFRQQQKFKNVVRQKATLLRQATKLERMNAKNISLANVDILTSLPNRRSFFNQLDALTSEYANKPHKKLIVGLLDLDGFKRINDVYGHPAGDDLLIKSSQRIQDIVGKNIVVARLGGDEFGLIVTKTKDMDKILQIGSQICNAMHQTFHLKEGNVQIGATVGFVEYPAMATNSQSLFERADYALCHSKQQSKGQPLIFSTELETRIHDVSKIEHQLRNANLEQEMSLMFQPIVDAQSATTIGFEALARWDNPELGKIMPEIFIKTAEQMGIIGELTPILLRKALDAAITWPENVYLSFNLSILDLSSPQTILSLVNIVEKSSFPTHRITFEITETAVMNDFSQANDSLQLLKLQGAKIALDDFGTGYSSLSYVQKMPLDRLKIDRSFIKNLTADQQTQNIVKTIVDLCNNLNLNCIIEGVETRQQLTLLTEMGCKYFQGYYFEQPLTPQAALEYIADENNISALIRA